MALDMRKNIRMEKWCISGWWVLFSVLLWQTAPVAGGIITRADMVRNPNGEPLLTSQGQKMINGYLYAFIEDYYEMEEGGLALSHSGSTVGEVPYYQHVYSYSFPQAMANYKTSNQAADAKKIVVKKEELSNPRKKKTWVRDAIVLDGTLALLQNPSQKDHRGLRAELDVMVVKEYVDKKGRQKTKKIKKGYVQLTGKKKGGIKIKTKGIIKRKYISYIANEEEEPTALKKKHLKGLLETGDFLMIRFDEVLIPYKYKVEVDREYVTTTTYTSFADNIGENTGAEVDFLSEMDEGPFLLHPVPESSTILLLLAGGIICLPRRKKIGQEKVLRTAKSVGAGIG